MRHKKSFNHLGRKTAHRKAMLSNMAASLIMHKRIKTTTAKAKALKRFVEPIVTRSKDDSTHSRRVVFSYLQDKEAVAELFREVGPKIADRPGGYTRVIKLGSRLGDSAEMAIIELVDFNETLLAEKASEKKSSRKRRGGKKKTEGAAAVGVQEQAVTEDVVEENAEEVSAETVAEETTEDVIAETVAEETTEEVVAEETPEEVVAEAEVVDSVEETVEEKAVEEAKSEEPTPAEAKADDVDETPEKEEKEDNDSEKKES